MQLRRPLRSLSAAGRDVTVARLLMVGGMAGMLLPLPAVAWWALAGVFAVDAGWLCWRLGRRWPVRGEAQTHRLHHLACHLAMLYLIALMARQAPGGHAMPGMAPAMPGIGTGAGLGPMLLAADLAIVIYFVAVGVWAALRLVPGLAPAGPGCPAGTVTSTRAATAYQVGVSVAMLAMLFGSLR